MKNTSRGGCQKTSLTIMILVDILDAMGGAERNIYVLAKGLIARGHRIIVCPLKGGLVSQGMKQEGFDVRALQVIRIYDFRGFKTLVRLLAMIKRERVTNLLTYHESADFLGFSVALLSGTPIVSSRRDTGFKLKKRHTKIYQIINRYFDHILANASAVKESIVKGQRSNFGNVSIIPNGVDVSPQIHMGTRVINGINVCPDCLNVGCLANIRPIKGLETLISAAALVLKDFPKTQFFLVGSKDSDKIYYNALIKQILRLKIQEQVIFTGGVDFQKVPAILSAMDICVLPSLSEGMSNTLLESMSAGKPAVATAVGGNPELVEHGKTGFLVPPEAPEAMAEALRQLLSNPDLRYSMGRQARYKAENEFSTEKMVERVEGLLRQVNLKR